MSDPEKFLTRWSRRKREVEQNEAPASPETAAMEPDPALPPEAVTSDSPEGQGETQAQVQPFDPASLPPIESITAQTDIRGYFAPGVPSDLARAALRRVWSADPAIRDFIGLSENAWDFNAPETIPGFGPITASDDVAGMMRRMLGEAREAVQQIVPDPEKEASEPPQIQDDTAEQRPMAEPAVGTRTEPVSFPHRGEEATLPAIEDGSQNEPGSAQAIETASNEPVVRRGHGSALPK
jgi:hypothetical protein